MSGKGLDHRVCRACNPRDIGPNLKFRLQSWGTGLEARAMKNRNHASVFTEIAVEFKTREAVPFTFEDIEL